MAATRQGRGKRYLPDLAWAVKLFARLTELSWSDVRDICASSRHCLLAQKKAQKITEYRDTAPLILVCVYVSSAVLRNGLSKCFKRHRNVVGIIF